MVKILHTADIQLDAPFRFLGERGQQQREQLRATLRRIAELAVEGRYDLLLVAGDLFDSPRPLQATVDFATTLLGNLPLPVCILPGNHDPAEEDSVYRRSTFPANVRVLLEQPAMVEYPELDLAVYGHALGSAGSRQSPLRALARRSPLRWHIAMAHGNLVRPDIPAPSRPIRPEEIRDCGMDYVALGDWHAYADCSQGTVAACYCGAPEPMAPDQAGAGMVASVELGPMGIRVQPVRVARLRAADTTLDISGLAVAQVVEALHAQADAQLMLRVTLTGLLDLGTVLDASALEEELGSAFYYLECVPRYQTALSAAELESQEGPLLATFLQYMRARLDAATDDDQRRCAEQALQLGVALLQGKRVF